MKIAVFHNLPSGGAKRNLYGFIKWLTNAGHVIDVFTPSTADEGFLPLRECVNAMEIFPVRNTLRGMFVSSVRYFPFLPMSLHDLKENHKQIADRINSANYDIVFSEQDRYTHSPFFLRFIKRPTLYFCQQPVRSQERILRKISQDIENGNFRGIAKRVLEGYWSYRFQELDRRNASFAENILANSYFSSEAILRSYGRSSFVSYLGIDTDVFKPLRTARENYVLSVGSLTPNKGYDFVVRSLGFVDKKARPKLVIVSNSFDPAWKRHIEEIAFRREVEIEIETLIEDEKLVMFYNQAKLFVYAPYLEPFGLAAVEAMACGTPVIAVKEGGVRESVIHNETGILTERDERVFGEAVERLLLDDKRRKTLGKKGTEMVRGFWTLEHAGERLAWHLERVAHRR